MDREKQIVRSSMLNVLGNVVLAIAKGAAGVASGSVAIILDAVNSLTDAFGSVIAIIGTKLAGRSASHNHPFGFGRIEYLTSIIIAALILSAGISSFIEAIRSIANPTTPQYTFVSLAVVAVAALVKFGLGVYLIRTGKRLNSGSLVGSGTDSMMDGGVSVATFSAGIIYITLGWQIESVLAACIALLIIKSGAQLLFSTASKLLGERMSPDVVSKVEREVRAVDGVRFASGLVLLDFGPDEVVGTIHVTVDGHMTVSEFDVVAREVRSRVLDKCGVTLAGVTPYADTGADESARKVRAAVGRVVWGNDDVVEMRGLYADPQTHIVRFDAITKFETADLNLLRKQIIEDCEQVCPGWDFEVRVMHHIGD